METSLGRIAICIKRLDESEIWSRPNKFSNSIGNLVSHLNGNIKQWILSGLAGEPDQRDRNSEFSVTGGKSGEELLRALDQTIKRAIAAIRDLDPPRLTDELSIQGFQTSPMGAIIHVVEHLSYHTGQITFQSKILNPGDAGYYSGLNLNVRNESGGDQ